MWLTNLDIFDVISGYQTIVTETMQFDVTKSYRKQNSPFAPAKAGFGTNYLEQISVIL